MVGSELVTTRSLSQHVLLTAEDVGESQAIRLGRAVTRLAPVHTLIALITLMITLMIALITLITLITLSLSGFERGFSPTRRGAGR